MSGCNTEESFVLKIYKLILLICSTICFAFYFLSGVNHCSGMRLSVYFRESLKLVRYYWTQRGNGNIDALIRSFFLSDLVLYSDNLLLEEEKTSPIVLVVVKDEIDRMKLFFEHYRSLGVNQFVVIDNSSIDGTREFVSAQRDTRVYLIKDLFHTQKKVAWIEKVLALTGYDRWYVVVDSDELLDYVGSETHALKELIDSQSKIGEDYLQGYLVDMYSEKPIFSISCRYKDIPHIFNLFDKDSYYREGDKHVFGGARGRLFGLRNLLSKQSVFLFKPGMIYSHPHYLYARNMRIHDKYCYVLRHYKFLERDRSSYEARIKEKNFYDNSIEYKTIMDKLETEVGIPFEYDGSTKYSNSDSLRVLPFLTWVDWDSRNQAAV